MVQRAVLPCSIRILSFFGGETGESGPSSLSSTVNWGFFSSVGNAKAGRACMIGTSSSENVSLESVVSQSTKSGISPSAVGDLGPWLPSMLCGLVVVVMVSKVRNWMGLTNNRRQYCNNEGTRLFVNFDTFMNCATLLVSERKRSRTSDESLDWYYILPSYERDHSSNMAVQYCPTIAGLCPHAIATPE